MVRVARRRQEGAHQVADHGQQQQRGGRGEVPGGADPSLRLHARATPGPPHVTEIPS